MDAQDYPIRHFEQMTRLATKLKTLPAQLLEHSYEYDVFGSWRAVIRFKGIALRLVFDGRDREYVLEPSSAPKRPYQWEQPIWRKMSAVDEDLCLRE